MRTSHSQIIYKTGPVMAPRVVAKALTETPTGQTSWEIKIRQVQGEVQSLQRGFAGGGSFIGDPWQLQK